MRETAELFASGSACSKQGRLLCSRSTPPSPVADELDRATRFAGADGLPPARLLLIEAPAGFGKTMLIRQWWSRLTAAGVAVSWLSFNEGACRDGTSLTCLRELVSDATESRASRSAAIEAAPPHIIFLNDIHHARPAIVATIVTLLRDAAPGVHVVATSRRPLSQDFVDAGMTEGVIVRRWSDLVYSAGDLCTLLHENGPSETLERLCYRLMGWPAMVHLLHGVARHWPGAVMEFAFDRAKLDDAHHYFMEEVYAVLDARERSVFDLAMASIHLTAATAEDVLDLADAALLLERLARYHGLLELEDGRYRVHDLMRSLARRTLPSGSADLHRRIARRSEREGNLAQAVFHAVELRDGEYAADILRRAGGWDTALQIGSGTIDRLSSLMVTTRSDAELAVGQTFALLQSGRTADARRTVDELKRTSFAGRVGTAGPSEWVVLDLLVAHYQNRIIAPDLVDRLYRKLLDEPGISPRILLVLNTHFRAYSYYDIGDYRRSRRWLDAAVQQAADAELFYAQIYALIFGALTNYRLADLTAAYSCLRRAEHVAALRLNGIDLERHQGMIQIFSALIAWERDAEALASPEIAAIEGRMLSGYDRWPPIILCFYLCTAEMIVAERDLAHGLDHLDRGIALARREGWHRIATELTVRKIFLSLEGGAWQQSARIISALDPAIVAAPDDPHLMMLVRFAHAWQALAEGDDEQALAIIEPFNRVSMLRGHGDLATLGYVLAALAKERRGDVASARSLIVDAIGPEQMHARSRWFKRLRKWAGVGVADIWPSDTTEIHPENRQPAIPLDNLTDRERQILQMIAGGFCVKEIARLLGIKPNTVASYRKLGYRKLGISKKSGLLQNSGMASLEQ